MCTITKFRNRNKKYIEKVCIFEKAFKFPAYGTWGTHKLRVLYLQSFNLVNKLLWEIQHALHMLHTCVQTQLFLSSLLYII